MGQLYLAPPVAMPAPASQHCQGDPMPLLLRTTDVDLEVQAFYRCSNMISSS